MSVEGINTRPFIYKIGDIVETNSDFCLNKIKSLHFVINKGRVFCIIGKDKISFV